MAGPMEVEEFTIETREALQSISLLVAQNCLRTLDITSRHLDPAIYDQALFVEAVKQIVLNNRLARIRLLVTDIAPLVSRGHRLIELATRLSSFISIRKPGRDYKNFNEAMVLADNKAYIHRRFADRFESVASYDDPRRTADLTGRFEEIWERAEIDANFRRLQL
jgi:hypothetical protein